MFRGSLSGHIHASEALVHAQTVLHVHLVLATVLGCGAADGQRGGGTADLEVHPAGKRKKAGPRINLRASRAGLYSLPVPRPRPPPAGLLGPIWPRLQRQGLPSPVILLDVLPVLGPAHVGRRLAHDLRTQRHRGAFARLSVIRSLLNFRRD